MRRPKRSPIVGTILTTIEIGRTIVSFAEAAIRWGAVGLSRRTNSSVMSDSNAREPGGMRATVTRCWPFVVPSITAPSIRYSSVISNGYGKRKNHRMLPYTHQEIELPPIEMEVTHWVLHQ